MPLCACRHEFDQCFVLFLKTFSINKNSRCKVAKIEMHNCKTPEYENKKRNETHEWQINFHLIEFNTSTSTMCNSCYSRSRTIIIRLQVNSINRWLYAGVVCVFVRVKIFASMDVTRTHTHIATSKRHMCFCGYVGIIHDDCQCCHTRTPCVLWLLWLWNFRLDLSA